MVDQLLRMRYLRVWTLIWMVQKKPTMHPRNQELPSSGPSSHPEVLVDSTLDLQHHQHLVGTSLWREVDQGRLLQHRMHKPTLPVEVVISPWNYYKTHQRKVHLGSLQCLLRIRSLKLVRRAKKDLSMYLALSPNAPKKNESEFSCWSLIRLFLYLIFSPATNPFFPGVKP